MSKDFDLKVSQAKKKISENFVKEESNGLYIGDFHFFMLPISAVKKDGI